MLLDPYSNGTRPSPYLLLDGETACPCCGIRALKEDDTDGVCAYCAMYTLPEAEAAVEKARRHHKRPGMMDSDYAEFAVNHVRFDSIDLMDPLFYGGDRDTMVNLIDFECCED